MKHFKNVLAFVPLLSLLAMSPSVLESKASYRGIASVIEEEKIELPKQRPELTPIDVRIPSIKHENQHVVEREKIELELPKKIEITDIKVDIPKIVIDAPKVEDKHPKLTAITSKVDEKALMKDANLDIEKFKVKRDELKIALLKEKDEFKKNQADKKLVEEQRSKIESLVINLLLVEGGLKDLLEKNGIDPTEQEKSELFLAESKDIAEGLLVELEVNEELVAKGEVPSEEKPVVAKEDNKKEVKDPKQIAKDGKDSKKDKTQTDQEKVICDLQAETKALSKQMETLLADQNKIMQSLMSMTQMMMMQMLQNQQQQMMNQMSNFNSMGTQTPYQYANQTTAGNWVYYPQGFQPSQQNIFAQPQGQQGMYPDQVHAQSSWNVRPQNYFQPQRPQGFNPGTFGGDPTVGHMGFNMGSPAVANMF